jgi:hypothetical protein
MCRNPGDHFFLSNNFDHFFIINNVNTKQCGSIAWIRRDEVTATARKAIEELT